MRPEIDCQRAKALLIVFYRQRDLEGFAPGLNIDWELCFWCGAELF